MGVGRREGDELARWARVSWQDTGAQAQASGWHW